MSDCESISLATWIMTATTVVSLVWAIVNEVLANRKGDRNQQVTCVGDCVREILSSKKKQIAQPESMLEEAPNIPSENPVSSWWKN